MSWPKILAVPAEGGQKPRRVWMRVDLPAPLGPRRPMVRAEREMVRFCRISRLPKRTLRPESSMMEEAGST